MHAYVIFDVSCIFFHRDGLRWCYQFPSAIIFVTGVWILLGHLILQFLLFLWGHMKNAMGFRQIVQTINTIDSIEILKLIVDHFHWFIFLLRLVLNFVSLKWFSLLLDIILLYFQTGILGLNSTTVWCSVTQTAPVASLNRNIIG